MADTDERKTWPEVREEERAALGLTAAQQPIGLALSGGGIRAATFSLGLLQGLAKENLLSKFHYLSTVSGGGYIGSWLSALIARRGDEHNLGTATDPQLKKTPQGSVEAILAPPSGQPREDSAIRFLRTYSNYLTPQIGIMSLDTWTAIVTFTRNLAINLSVLLCVVVTLILAVHSLIAGGAAHLTSIQQSVHELAPTLAFWIGLGLLVISAAVIGWRIDRWRSADHASSQSEVLVGVVTPAFGAAIGWAFHYFEVAQNTSRPELWRLALTFAIINGGLAMVAVAANFLARRKRRNADATSAASHNAINYQDIRRLIVLLVCAAVGGAVAGAMIFGYIQLMAEDGTLGAFIATRKVDDWLSKLYWVAQVDVPENARNYLISAFNLALGALAMLVVFATALMVMLGLAKRDLSESDREWLARLGAWLYVGSALWGVVFAVVTLGPGLVIWLGANFPVLAKSGALLWVTQSIGALILGKSAVAGGREPKKPWLETLLSFAPYFFILGVLFIVAYGVDRVLIHVNNPAFSKTVDIYCDEVKASSGASANATKTTITANAGANGELTATAVSQPETALPTEPNCAALNRTISLPLVGIVPNSHPAGWMLMALLAAIAVTFVISWRVDVNLFSFQQFYRHRLTRCYLGASRFRAMWESTAWSAWPRRDHTNTASGRTANQFTDLAVEPKEDDLHLATLRDQRPFHIINTALNMTAPGELGWQERKAASFTLTPLHCGFSLPGAELLGADDDSYGAGYRATSRFSRGKVRPEDEASLHAGATLGMALSTSGAAASSSMGHSSTGALALLLTIFNVRLGRWVGNPAHRDTPWKEQSPWWGLRYLLYELFGSITNRDKFVYLSDGGHFENLGVYELVRRRCKLIVVSSCGKDSDYVFDDLSNAIRLCNIDFGIPIEIEPRAIKPDERGLSKTQFVTGLVRYSVLNLPGQETHEDGLLIYIKPAITGRTSVDIRHYQSLNPDFPQESTTDQWYTESQFESYRKLGLETARAAFAPGKKIRTLFDQKAG